MLRISKSELIKLQKQLGTDAKIGERYNITRQAVHHMRKKYGIVSRLAGNPERNKKMVALYKKGLPGTAIAEKFNIAVTHTYKIIHRGGGVIRKPAKKAAKKK